jgi:hypothetical protein
LEYWPGEAPGPTPQPWICGVAPCADDALVFVDHHGGHCYRLDLVTEDTSRVGVKLHRPRHVHGLPGGGVCISQPSIGRVTLLDAKAEVTAQIGLDGFQPWACCPWRDGYLVTDAMRGLVAYLGPHGALRPVRTDIILHQPRSISPTPDGGFVVADSEAQIVAIFDADGRVRLCLGKYRQPDNTTESFISPEHAFVSKDQSLVVCDTRKNRLVWFDRDGRMMRVHGGPDHVGSDNRCLWSPIAATEGLGGDFFVADASNGRLLCLNPADGKERTAWGVPKVRRAVFHHPRSCEPSARGLLVADSYRDRIVEFGDGRIVAEMKSWAGCTFFWPRFATEFGDVRFICDSRNGRLLVGSSQDLRELRLHCGGKQVELLDPHTVRPGPSGTFLVSDTKRSRVLAFDLDGEVHGGWGTLGPDLPLGSALDLDDVHDATFDPRGGIWIVDTGHHRLVRAGVDGEVVGLLQRLRWPDGREDGFLSPRCVEVLSDGTLVICDSGNHRVVWCAEDGRVLGAYGGARGHAIGHLSDPRGLRRVGDHLLVSDYLNDRILRMPIHTLLTHLKDEMGDAPSSTPSERRLVSGRVGWT